MKLFNNWMVAILLLVLLIGTLAALPSRAEAVSEGASQYITEWQMILEQPGQPLSFDYVKALPDNKGWFDVRAGEDYPIIPEGVSSAWVKFKLPELTQMRPALGITKLYAQNVAIYINNKSIFQLKRDYAYDRNNIVLPSTEFESGKIVYIELSSKYGRLGLQEAIITTDYNDLFMKSIREELIDIIIGFSLVFISFFMLVSALFLNRAFIPGWSSLFVVMLSIGIMILSYSSFMDRFYPELGILLYYLFDIASALLIPALFIFYEKIFGDGPFRIMKKMNKYLLILIIINILLLIISFSGRGMEIIYQAYSMFYLGSTFIIGNIILIIILVTHCLNGDKEAKIMAFGLGIFSIIGLTEVIWYLISDNIYKMHYWKFGVVFFIASLILVLVRRIMSNYEAVVEYSKQIELYNNELQRSEKIELISHLAASIAHEVRNPLQVTRGFLQITRERVPEKKSKDYMAIAINELDRASEIITDFLTFAKPDLVEMNTLDVETEINQIEAILAPLATMKGSKIKVISESALFVNGNSSKFKQALINLIKNSIEALKNDGEIIITANRYNNDAVEIIIKDNGEGIDREDLKRLGEPYYTKKSKGTGLGLMVTFRIIEAMQGEISFSSVKGEGTEVRIQLPAT